MSIVSPRSPSNADEKRRPIRSGARLDRKSTRLNSSHCPISYAVFCLKKKTGHQKILRAKSGSEQYCSDEAIDELIEMARNGADAKGLRVLLRRLVPAVTERIAIISAG